MRRVSWVKQAGFCLVAVVGVAMVAGVAWADPVGTADLPQISNPIIFSSGGEQRTFRTTDPISFLVNYYDNDAACHGVPPTSVQLGLFNIQGRLIQQVEGGSVPDGASLGGRILFKEFASVASIPLTPGGYGFTFTVFGCNGAKVVVSPVIVTFSVFAP